MKSALIIDADNGAGLATAKALGQLGYKIWIGERSRERGLAAQAELVWEGYEAEYLPLDLRDGDTIVAAAETIAAAAPCLDILVNNAAGQATEEEALPGEIAASNDNSHVFGAVAVTRAMLPLLRRSPIGRVVSVSSPLGSFGLQGREAFPWGPLLALC